MYDRKSVVNNADMLENMLQDAMECATQALEEYNNREGLCGNLS
uniref:Uncharacterized protein n=1 Tax=Cyprinodon variegatus TaxID=28743 RepID=A0A3Q2E3N4_CYPVA